MSKQSLSIETPEAWTVSVSSGVFWLDLSRTEGSGNGIVTVALNSVASSQPLGARKAVITVTTSHGRQSVTVALHVVPATPPPAFTYVSGPNGCTQTEGYPDADLCVVPGEKPPGNFTPPAPGGSYNDPNFGAKVTILTATDFNHAYSSIDALSAHNKYLLFGRGGQGSILEVANRRMAGTLPVSFEGPVWDPTDDNILYFVAGTIVKKYLVNSGKVVDLIDYSKPPYKFTKVVTGFRTDTSKDNWIPLFAHNESSFCALDLNLLKTYCAKYDQPINGIKLDDTNSGARIAKGIDRATGKRYVIFVTRPTIAVYSVNQASGKLDFEFLGPENPDFRGNGDGVCDAGETCLTADHFDTSEDSSGIQWLFGAVETQNPCEYGVISVQLNKGTKGLFPVEVGGGRRRIMPLFRCGGVDSWVDMHAGCAKLSSYCVLSTTYGGFRFQRDVNDPTPIKRSAHLSEIFVVKNNGEEVRRLMEHRSVPLSNERDNSYWTTPRACISNDGRYVVADSNFGEPSAYRVLLIETGYGAKEASASAPAKTERNLN